jgi:hypothetical protein
MHQLAMTDQMDRQLADEAIRVYVDWREESAGVWDAFDLWKRARGADAATAFAGYRAALDREELAAHTYADLLERMTAAHGEQRHHEAELSHRASATRHPSNPMR